VAVFVGGTGVALGIDVSVCVGAASTKGVLVGLSVLATTTDVCEGVTVVDSNSGFEDCDELDVKYINEETNKITRVVVVARVIIRTRSVLVFASVRRKLRIATSTEPTTEIIAA
jgi:hypothetical protein